MYIRMGATVFVQPLDLVKNRMQLSGKTCFACVPDHFMMEFAMV